MRGKGEGREKRGKEEREEREEREENRGKGGEGREDKEINVPASPLEKTLSTCIILKKQIRLN